MLKSFSIYTVALLVDKGANFLILPLITFYLTIEDIGELSLHNTIFSFTLPLISLGVQGAVSVNYFKSDRAFYPRYLTSSVIPPFIMVFIATLIIFILRDLIKTEFELNLFWVFVIPFFSFLSFFNTLLLIDCQIKNQPKIYVLFSLSTSLITILLSLFFIIELDFGYEGRLIGQYGTILLIFILSFYFMKYKKGIIVNSFNKNDCKDSLKYGLPLLPHIIGFMIINMSDKFFITSFLGKEVLGIYNVGYWIGSSISILSSAFATSITPFSFSLFAENSKESKIKVVKVYWLFIILIVFSAFCLLLIAPLIFKYLIDNKFLDGIVYVKYIAFGFVFQGLYLLFGNVLFFLKRTEYFFYLAFVNIGLNVFLNFYLVQLFGAVGAGYAFVITCFIFFLLVAFFSNKMFPLPWFYFLKKENIVNN